MKFSNIHSLLDPTANLVAQADQDGRDLFQILLHMNRERADDISLLGYSLKASARFNWVQDSYENESCLDISGRRRTAVKKLYRRVIGLSLFASSAMDQTSPFLCLG